MQWLQSEVSQRVHLILSIVSEFHGSFRFRFATEKLRKSHIERIHQTVKGVKSEICEVCAKTFSKSPLTIELAQAKSIDE